VSTYLSAEPSFPFVPTTTTIIAPIIKCECLKIEVCESISEKSSFPPCFLKEKSLILLLPKSHVVNVIKLPVKKSRKSQANTLLGARRSAVLEEKLNLSVVKVNQFILLSVLLLPSFEKWMPISLWSSLVTAPSQSPAAASPSSPASPTRRRKSTNTTAATLFMPPRLPGSALWL